MMVWRALGGLGSNSKPLILRSKNQRFLLLLWNFLCSCCVKFCIWPGLECNGCCCRLMGA